jgi:two-component system nitrate/nitrite response regulator NarL
MGTAQNMRMAHVLLRLHEERDMKTRAGKSFVRSPVEMGDVEQISHQFVRETAIIEAGAHNSSANDSSVVRHTEQAAETAFGERTCTRSVMTLLVDPNGLFREGLTRILAETAYCPVASAASLDDVQPMLSSQSGALLVIADAVHDHSETCQQVRSLKERNPSVRVIMLVEQYDLDQMLVAFDAGAAACLMKSTSHEALVKALDLVMLGETIFPATILTQLRETTGWSNRAGVKSLSARETSILECLMEGASNKIIARKLHIAEATVKVHIKSILRKLQAKNRTQAAIWASTHIVTRKP